jgi:hypothetical protein
MYDFKTHTLDGVSVSYTSLPYHAMATALQDTRLTQAAKNVYITLLMYAAYKKTQTFSFSATWISEKIGATRKTVASALSQLKEIGLVSDNGIVIPKISDADISLKQKPRSNRDFVQTKLESNNEECVLFKQKNNDNDGDQDFVQTKPKNNAGDILFKQNADDVIAQRLAVYEKTFGVGRVPKSIIQATMDSVHLEVDQPQEEKITRHEEKITAAVGKKVTPHITITSNSYKNNTSGNARSVDVCFTSAHEQFVGTKSDTVKRKSSVTKSMGDMITGKFKVAVWVKAYIEKTLISMNVTSAKAREDYLEQIEYAVSPMGAFHSTYTQNPIKALRSIAKLVGQGRWSTPCGMYA